VRDNLNETAPAKATATGQYPAASGPNAIAMRSLAIDVDDTIYTTSSTSYTGISPAVTATTGQFALVHGYSYVTVNTNSEAAYYTFNISGATTQSANDNRAVQNGRYTVQFAIAAGFTVAINGLTSGSNTFTAQYRVTNGVATGTFASRRLTVQPF
jgi:hypothetical protein